MQQELTEGPLHDERGHLIETGWAPAERRRYVRNAIKAPWYRIKEWDYYCVLGEDEGIAFVVADNSYMSLVSMSWLDFTAGTMEVHSAMGGFSRGRLMLPESADAGDIFAEEKDIALTFRHRGDTREIEFDCPAFAGGKGASGLITLAEPPMDRMVIATPFPPSPRAFYYNQKINCMPANGRATIAGRDVAFTPDKHFAVLDWGRGVWPYDNQWYWGSASGLAGGIPFGFNIGYGFGDTSAASENVVFVDGKAHKLGRVDWHIPEDGYAAGPWAFKSDDGRFNVTMDPVYERAEKTDLLVLRSITHQVFGKFSGTVILDDGTPLRFDNVMGFAEDVRNRW